MNQLFLHNGILKKHIIFIIVFSLSSSLHFVCAQNQTWYVNYIANGNNNGHTPQDAFLSLHDAINAAIDGDTIKVAQGSYKPSQRLTGGTTNQDNTFYINKNINLLGGYSDGFIERDIYLYTTYLDGNMDVAGNCYHVLVFDGDGKSGFIDGFTVQNGNANGAATVSGIVGSNGGGLYISGTSLLTISRMTFRNNTANGNGGAIYNGSATTGASIISQCTFVQNKASLGGAVYSITGGTTGFNTIINSTFSKNTTTAGSGGAVYFSNSTASSSKIAFCTFNGNTAFNNTGNAIYYASITAKELKANIIYGNGTGNTEITNLGTTANTIMYNIIRDAAVTGSGNTDNQNITAGNTAVIFQDIAADGTAVLNYYGGANEVLMPIRSGFAYNKIPATNALAIDPANTDQRDSVRIFDGAAEIGAVEIQWKWPACTGNTTWYVDANGNTLASGMSINEPAGDLSMVLANPCLKSGDTIKVVGDIGDGLIYRPTVMIGSGTTNTIRDRSFYVSSSIVLLGGYGSGFLVRDVYQYKTVLDGDGNVLGDNTDNSYHVLVWNTTDGQTGYIDGFTIQNGNANVNSTNTVTRYAGGGIFQNSGALTISNAIFKNNLSGSTGGAIHSIAVLSSVAALSIDHTSFLSNTTTTNGGAIYRSSANGTLNITKSTFANNIAALGGAIYSAVGAAANLNYISNTTFSGNKTIGGSGGAVYFSANIAGISKITYSTFNSNQASNNSGNAIYYTNAGAKELKGNIIYGNGTGAEITNLGTNAGIMYNIIRDMTVTGTGNTGNQNVPAGNGTYIFADVTTGDVATLTDNGGLTQTIMPVQGSLAQNRIPALTIDTTNTDQRDEPRYTAKFTIGSVELPSECNSTKVWYVDGNALPGGTGLSSGNPINDLSLLLAMTCLQTGDTVKVTKGNYKPTTIPFENTTTAQDRNFLIPVSIHLRGGYEPDFNEATRETNGTNTILDGDLGVIGTITDNAYHVVVWNTTDGQTGTINGFTIQNGYGNVSTAISGVTRNKGAGLNQSQGDLTLINTIVQNNTSTGAGGGIYSQSGNLSLFNTVVQSNTTTSTGGGIHNESGNLSLANALVQNNTSTSTGGGIQSQAITILTLRNSTVSGNKASNNGGGIYSNQSVTLNNTTISGNTATGTSSGIGFGGGVYAGKDIELIGKVVLTNNTATGTNTGSGSGIYKAVSAGTSFLANQLDTLILTGNRAMVTTGGGIYAGEDFEMTNLKYADISNNYAKTSGGGIYANKLLTLSNAGNIIIQSDTAGQHGGGIYANSILTISKIKNITLQDNKAGTTDGVTYSATAYHGGAIYAPNALTLSGKVTVNNNKASGSGGGIFKSTTGVFDVSTIDTLILIGNESKNMAASSGGGGLYAGVAVEFTGLRYADISNNLAAMHGGGIYANNTLNLSGKILLNNNTANSSGGGIYKNSTNTFITTQLDSLTAENNEAKIGQGGALYLGGSTDLLNPKGVFRNNKAGLDGGAIYAASAFSISDFVMNSNTSEQNGGAIYANNTLNLLGYMGFDSNTAVLSGGAVCANYTVNSSGFYTGIAVANLDSISMNNNSAGVSGGGIYAKGDMQFYGLIKGSFTGNTAVRYGGVFYGEKSLYIQNAVFSKNKADTNGGAIYTTGNSSITTEVKKSTFDNNSAQLGGAIYKDITGLLNISQSTFAGNTAMRNGGAIASFYGTNNNNTGSQQNYTNNTFSGNSADTNGGAIYFGYTVSSDIAFGARATIAFCSFNGNTSSGNSNAIHYEKTSVGNGAFGALFGNIICNSPTGTEINSIAGFNVLSQYNIIRGITLSGTGNQDVLYSKIDSIFDPVINNNAVLAGNGGPTQTLMIKKDGLATEKIPQSAAIQYATNDQRDENRIVSLADIGSVELSEDLCTRPTIDPVVWYVDSTQLDNNGDGIIIPNKYLETVLNNPCLKDGDTVKVAKGTYYSTNTDATQSFFITKSIVFKGGYSSDDFSEANRNIAANQTILDGKKTSYHTVVWNTDEVYTGIIDGVTIQNGKGTGSTISGSIPQNKGGGLFLSLGKLIISNTTIQDNIASSAGGGIYSSQDGSLTLQNTRSFRNKAGYNGTSFSTGADGTDLVKQIEKSGGGVCVLGSFAMVGSLLFQNDTAGVNGGGIFKGTFNNTDATLLDTLTMTGCVARVTATGSSSQGNHGGGGIYTMCGLDLTAAKKLFFTNCQAPTGGMGEGGGIFINNKTGRLVALKVANATFINCICGDDGGALESFGGTVSIVYAKDSYFKGCRAGRYGGAFGCGHAIELAGKIEIDSCIAGANGGGISQWVTGGTVLPVMFNATLLDTLIITRCGAQAPNSSVHGSSPTSNHGGGGIWVQQNILDLSTVKYLYIVDCYSGNHGGGIKIQTAGYNLTLGNNTFFARNKGGWTGTTELASMNGGAIYNAGGDVEIRGEIVLDSNTASLSGGGIYVPNGYSIIATSLNTLIMRGNKALNGSGGGLYTGNKALDLSKLTYGYVENNYAKVNGGAIYAGEAFSITRTGFLNNTADGNGGAIWKAATGKITIDKSTFAGNKAKSGGAIYNNITTGTNNSLFFNSTFSQNQATDGDGGAIYMASNQVGSVSRIIFGTFNGNIATGTGNAIFYTNPTDEAITGSIVYGNGATDINNVVGLSASYNVFKQLVNGTGNIQVTANDASSIFRTISSGEIAMLENNGGKTQTLALKVGGYAHNVTPGDIATGWMNTYIGNYTDQRDSARWVGCKVDAGGYELQASEYDVSYYILKQNVSVCGNVPIYPSMLIDTTANMKDTLYFSDNAYTQRIYLPASGFNRIYIEFKSNTNCVFYDSLTINFTSVTPKANINNKSLTVCPGSTTQLRESTVPPQTGVTYNWTGFEDFSSAYSGSNTAQLSFTAKSLDRDTTFYIYLTVSSGCGVAKDSCKTTLKGVQTVNINIPNNVITDACVSRPFEFTIKTKNTSYYTFLPAGLNITGTDQDGAQIGNNNSSVKYDSATFYLKYTPAITDKGKNISIIFRSTGGCSYRQDTMNFLVLPEPTAAKLEIVSQPAGLQKICQDTIYTLKLIATNIGGLINNTISLVDMGNSRIMVDSAKYLYPVTASPLETDWQSLGSRDSLTDPLDRVPRYQFNNMPNINGSDSVLVRFYVHAGCGFRSGNIMKFKANVFDKCGTSVGIADMISNPFKLESGVSNDYIFDNSFSPSILNPKTIDSVLLRIKVTISGSYETDSTRESIISEYPTYLIPDFTTFTNIHNAGGNVTVTDAGGGMLQYSLPIPSGLKGTQTTFTDYVEFTVRCYAGNTPCGELELRNQIFYNYKTNACGDSCQVTDIRAQSIDTIDVQRYLFSLMENGNGITQLGKWEETVDLLSVTPFLPNDSIKIHFFVDKNNNSRHDASDSLVYSGYVYSNAGYAVDSTLQIPFTNIPYKSGYQLLAYSDDVKLCDTLAFPINIISGPDTICQGVGHSAIFEAPEGMLDYSFDAITGATTILDNTLPPNQIKKGFTNYGDMSIRGTYRRVIYNEETNQNDTIQSTYSTFKFYVNPAITADSVAIIGNVTDICTPATIKLYAKDLKNATAHSWTVPTATGSFTGQTTDTLTYTLYPRTSDTAIVVYYTATATTACSNWTDSIRLTLYETLTQPDPKFLDTTICKGSNTLLEIGVPSGGGTTVYTYQWQEKTRNTDWIDCLGTSAGYTGTDENYLPGGLSDTTLFRRITTGKCASDTSKIITMNVRETIATLNIIKNKNITLCSGLTDTIVIATTNAAGILWTYIDDVGNRQELYDGYNIAGLGSVRVNGTNDTLIFTSLQQLTNTTAGFEITVIDKCGNVIDTATVNLKGYPTGRIVTLQDTAVCYGTEFNFATVVTNSTYIGIETMGIGTIGTVNNTSINYSYDSTANYYRPAASEANSTVKLRMKYRNDECYYQYDSINIFVLPYTTGMDLFMVNQPVSPQETCTDTVYDLKVKNTNIGVLKNVRVTLSDANNTRIMVDSTAYRYPYESGGWTNINDVKNGIHHTYLLPDLPGNDSLWVRIHVKAACYFTSGDEIAFSLQADDACGKQLKSDTLYSEPFYLKADSNLLNQYVISNITIPSVINSRSGDTINVRISALLAGGLNPTDSIHERIMNAIPTNLIYIPESFVNIHNAGGTMNEDTGDNGMEYDLTVPSGLTAGDSIVYSYKVLVKNAPCGNYDIRMQAYYADSVICDESCVIYYDLGETTQAIKVERYIFTLDTIKGYTRTGYWNAEIHMNAINGFFAGDSLKIDFYVDKNNSNFYDPADDPSVYTYYAKTDTTISTGGILKVIIDSVPVTYGKQLIAYSRDSLLCDITQFPITIMTSDDQICTSDTTIVRFPEGMTDYYMDAISGATLVPLTNNYPNENIRQIRWTAPRTADTVVFTGYYRRGGSSGPLSERTAFIAKINNAITYDGLSIIGNNTTYICSPNTIQVRAKNVNYATVRQWTASTEAGTLINADTDTLTYVINSRPESDTTIWIVYHATATGVCKDIYDSIPLTIYQNLSQPEPGFSDTVICEDTKVDIFMNDPAGGGVYNISEYVFQWQDSTTTRGWQDIAGAHESNYQTPMLIDTTWYRRIVTAKCDKDTGTVIRVAVYPQLEMLDIDVVYPLCMDDSFRLSLRIKGGKQPYMYSFDGTNFMQITKIDSVTTTGYTACHINTLLLYGNYTINFSDSSLCTVVSQDITIQPNSPSANPGTDVLYVKTTPSGNADGSDWDNAFDGKYLAWYLNNRAIINTKIYVAEGTYTPYLAGCDTASDSRTYSFVLKDGITLQGGYDSTAISNDLTSYDPKNNITRLSGEIQGDNDNTNNSYHVITVAQNAGVLLDGFYISNGYADGTNVNQNGGGILLNGGNSTVNLSHLVIEKNTATFGCGLYISENASILSATRLSNIIVRNNTDLISYGGAGMFAWGDFAMDSTTVEKNSNSAGIISWGGDMLIRNSTIGFNGKEGIYANNSGNGQEIKMRVINSTIAGNETTGIHLNNQATMSLTLDNTLLVNNAGNDLSIEGSTQPTLAYSYSIIGMVKYETTITDYHNIPIAIALDSLDDNGGWGRTMELLNPCENPAVQSGNPVYSGQTAQNLAVRVSPQPCIGAYDGLETLLISLAFNPDDTICERSNVTLSASVIPPAGVNVTGYQWQKEGTSGVWNNLASTSDTLHINSASLSDSGSYRVVVNSTCGARNSDGVRLAINALPDTGLITGSNNVCIGETITLTNSTASGSGIWKSTDTTIAKINNNGEVTGFSTGSTKIRYIVSNAEGCKDSTSITLTVKPFPEVSIAGSSSICVGTQTQLLPSGGGHWVSNNPSIASVTDDGFVTGITAGSATFTFTSSTTNCSNTTDTISVDTFPTVNAITGKNNVCVNTTIQLSCTPTGGVWTLSNTNAQIVGGSDDNPVEIKGVVSGQTYVSYVLGIGTCRSTSTFLLKIVPASPPEIIIGFER